MKIGTACLATVMRIVLPFACVAGLTATACGQWWTSYNPDPIIGVWTETSDGSYNRWTLELEGTSKDDIITGINIKVSTTSEFQWYSSSGSPVDAETTVDGYTHFLLTRAAPAARTILVWVTASIAPNSTAASPRRARAFTPGTRSRISREAFRRQKDPPAFWEQGPSTFCRLSCPRSPLPSRIRSPGFPAYSQPSTSRTCPSLPRWITSTPVRRSRSRRRSRS